MSELLGNLGNEGLTGVQGAPTLNVTGGLPTPFGSLAKLEIAPEIVRTLPAEFARRHCLLPIAVRNGTLQIATATPGNGRVIDDIRLLSGLEVEEFPAPAAEINAKISECYQVTVEKMIENLDPEKPNGEAKNLHDIEVMANEPTVVNLVNLIISTALRERASDIHLVPFENSIQLRYRVDGLLQENPPPPKHLHPALVSRIKIMADMNIAERFMPQDGHIQINNRGARVDIRVGTMPTIYGESLVMRLLEKNSKVSTAEELGLDAKRAKLLSSLVEKPHGLFLTTGPTGSGKTTTLYSILQSIYTPELKILTIEDPVEYELPGVAQIPVRPSRNFTFATGLRAILRQDPDVVMVGEIRDSETAEIAIRAALTGHQVFSTLHTNDATGAVTRLIDMGIEPFLIASSLEGVFGAAARAQDLSRLPRQETPLPSRPCAKKSRRSAAGKSTAELLYTRTQGLQTSAAIPGNRGRIGIFELLSLTSELKELILQKRSNAELKATAQKSMVTMHQDALQKAAAGMTSLEEILRVSSGDLQE